MTVFGHEVKILLADFISRHNGDGVRYANRTSKIGFFFVFVQFDSAPHYCESMEASSTAQPVPVQVNMLVANP